MPGSTNSPATSNKILTYLHTQILPQSRQQSLQLALILVLFLSHTSLPPESLHTMALNSQM